MEDLNTVNKRVHKIMMTNRRTCTINGVCDVLSFDIHEILLEERRKGKAILLISEDLEELFALSDRIAVLYSGRLFDPLPIEQATVDVIGRRMVGQEGGDGYEA